MKYDYRSYYYCNCGMVYKKNSKLILDQIKEMCELGSLDDHFHIDCECGLNFIIDCDINVGFLSDKDKYKQNVATTSNALINSETIKRDSKRSIDLISDESIFSILNYLNKLFK